MAKPVRYFFALVPGESGIAFLRERIDLLRGRGWDKFGRFVHPADIHLTLRFLGEIPEETSTALQAGASGIARRTAPFSYGLGPCLLFPSVSRARVIAGTVESGESLSRLVRALEDLCVQAGLAREDRPFRPHITLARLRQRMMHPNLPVQPGGFVEHASQFSLLRTNLANGPEAYEAVAGFPFGEAPHPELEAPGSGSKLNP